MWCFKKVILIHQWATRLCSILNTSIKIYNSNQMTPVRSFIRLEAFETGQCFKLTNFLTDPLYHNPIKSVFVMSNTANVEQYCYYTTSAKGVCVIIPTKIVSLSTSTWSITPTNLSRKWLTRTLNTATVIIITLAYLMQSESVMRCFVIPFTNMFRWCNGLARLLHWLCHLQGRRFKSRLWSV